MKTFGGTAGQSAAISELAFYGTEEATPVPIQIGGGNIDRVANFRVYDKYIDENQALEIWDAQKDVFREVKNTMTLHKGRLGLGTEEPEGRLAVLDEPHNLEEFPPRAMTGYKTYFEGHGEFKVIESTFQSGGQEGWQAFNGIYGVSGIGDAWLSGNDPTYNADGTSTGISSINGEAGEYIILEMPYRVKMKNVLVYPRGHNSSTVTYSNPPKDGKIWGRNDADELWTEIASYTNLSFGVTITDNLNGQHPQHVVINATQYYKYIAFQVQVANHNLSTTTVYTNIRELRYFGTREQGQSVLHDGQLTLTKNLNVPRIGPPLDADDTPRRDRLVVEYNTSTNPTFEGAVRDMSGRGNDAVLLDGAYYDATEKALVFDGVDDYINSGGIGIVGNDKSISVSYWIKARNGTDGLTGGQEYGIFHVGSSGSGIGVSVFNDYGGSDSIWVWIPSNYSYYVYNLAPGRFYHMTMVYGGGGIGGNNVHLYIDGVQISRSGTGGTTTATPTFNTNSELRIGDWFDTSSPYYRWPGSISNFKLYDCALTAQEVKTLYDMGRNGSVANPQPLHIAAPLYAPGSIVQVQYASTPLNSTSRQEIVGGELSDAANDIDYLDMNFKPKFANSSILLTAMINTNATHVASFGFKEDGTVIRTQAENLNSTGSIATVYEASSSTEYMVNVCIQVLIPANGTHTRRYNTAANSYWGDSSYTLYINDRASDDMRCISNMIVYEIAN